MISVAKTRVQYPLDLSQLYWLRLGRDSAPVYSPASFFFASPDGSTLLPAMNDEARFISALGDAITSLGNLPCFSGLQQLLADLTAANEMPAPRYPQAGDTDVSGHIVWVRMTTSYFSTPTIPPPRPPIWIAMVRADIAANGYSTPPANADIQFDFLVRNSTELLAGQAVVFDIVQGKFAPKAANVR